LFDDRLATDHPATLEQAMVALCDHVAGGYPRARREQVAESYRELVGTGRFLPTTVVLHHGSAGRACLGGCLVWPMPTNLGALFAEDIPALWQLLQAGNGVGFDLSVLPPRLWADRATGRACPGAVETLRAIACSVDGPMRYAGLKRAAFMASLAFDHPDIFEFVTHKRTGELPAANLSVGVDDRYLEALDRNGAVPLCWRGSGADRYLRVDDLDEAARLASQRGVAAPDLRLGRGNEVVSAAAGCVVGRTVSSLVVVSVLALHRMIAESAHACGDPGLLNLGAINRSNPTHPRYLADGGDVPAVGVGVIQTTAPCGEQPLLPYESCFLGSFDLSRFVAAGRFQFASLASAVPIAVQLLDDLMERSRSGIGPVDAALIANRKIGLGVMGLADVLGELELPYDSPGARALAADILRTIHEEAIEASRALARQRGTFPNWPHSSYARMGEPPRRHATLTTIAPTGHISQLACCSPSIEPYYRLRYSQAGTIRDCRPLAAKLAEIGYSLEEWVRRTAERNGAHPWNGTLGDLALDPTSDSALNARLRDLRRVFVTAVEVAPADHLAMLEALQPFVENGISKTVNLAADCTRDQVGELMVQALRGGLKGLTVFREGGERDGHLRSADGRVCTHGDGCSVD
jgi:ribonucleoside-diphosphate reductase alpha chain